MDGAGNFLYLLKFPSHGLSNGITRPYLRKTNFWSFLGRGKKQVEEVKIYLALRHFPSGGVNYLKLLYMV